MPPTLGWGATSALGDARELAAQLLQACAIVAAEAEESADGRFCGDWRPLLADAARSFEANRRNVAARRVAASIAEAERLAGARRDAPPAAWNDDEDGEPSAAAPRARCGGCAVT
eukprot:TRINITY_DN46383_c0_g1_i1.p8 TRINITY_DN46383_c0_g1~~TRINITY_DN46383_c0_g1_i1.p8  ORF type:complete len:115 (-),score=35.88 TRINITY_DN46383_c0_g1_i1:479-823(-)